MGVENLLYAAEQCILMNSSVHCWKNEGLPSCVGARDTWYSLLMAIGKDGDFFALVYDPSNPEKIIKDRRTIAEWKGLTWTFKLGADKGTILFDDLMEIKFDSIK
jgi:hypothetical protein